jgi:hypothetical protein
MGYEIQKRDKASHRWLLPECPACRKRLFTMQTFMDHLADDVLLALLNA